MRQDISSNFRQMIPGITAFSKELVTRALSTHVTTERSCFAFPAPAAALRWTAAVRPSAAGAGELVGSAQLPGSRDDRRPVTVGLQAAYEICDFVLNCGGLVRIAAVFCKSVFVLQHFPKSIRFAHCCTAPSHRSVSLPCWCCTCGFSSRGRHRPSA